MIGGARKDDIVQALAIFGCAVLLSCCGVEVLRRLS
jgi:hypothetical protein